MYQEKGPFFLTVIIYRSSIQQWNMYEKTQNFVKTIILPAFFFFVGGRCVKQGKIFSTAI